MAELLIKKIIVGLGNPGKKYKNTRHNLGFMVVDSLADSFGLNWKRKGLRAYSAEKRISAEKRMSIEENGEVEMILVKPRSFVNLSGLVVGRLLKSYKILSLEDLLVIHDDIDLSFGVLRIKRGGGDGGHRGVRSIIEEIGDNGFSRVRMGVGRPPEGMESSDYVLDEFSEEERGSIKGIIEGAMDAVMTILLDGVDEAMRRYNRKGK